MSAQTYGDHAPTHRQDPAAWSHLHPAAPPWSRASPTWLLLTAGHDLNPATRANCRLPGPLVKAENLWKRLRVLICHPGFQEIGHRRLPFDVDVVGCQL
jgi:hypothetical protein